MSLIVSGQAVNGSRNDVINDDNSDVIVDATQSEDAGVVGRLFGRDAM